MNYFPHKLVVIDYGEECEGTHRYAILAGWYGGYIGSNSLDGTKEKSEILKESDYTVNEPSLKRAESPKPASKQSYKHVYDPLEEVGSPF